MANMGMNVEDPRVRNRIAIIDLADLRVQLDEQGMGNRVDWMGQLIAQLTSYRNSIGFEILVFDSLVPFSRSPKWRTRGTKSSASSKRFVASV